MLVSKGGIVPISAFPCVASRSELKTAADLVLADWNGSRLLNPLIQATVTQQYWRASLSERAGKDDFIGASYVAFAACIGTDIFAIDEASHAFLEDEPVGLICDPEDGQRLILELYAVMRANGELSIIFDDYSAALPGSCFCLGCLVAERIGVKDSGDPVLRSIDLHTRIIAARLAIAGTA